MTRNSDLYMEDVFGCDHSPETAVTERGKVVYWLCRCGRKVKAQSESPDLCPSTGRDHSWQDPSKNTIVACRTCGKIKD